MKYCRIKPSGLTPIVMPIQDVPTILNESENSEVFIIEIIEMTDEEYNSLPESNGF